MQCSLFEMLSPFCFLEDFHLLTLTDASYSKICVGYKFLQKPVMPYQVLSEIDVY
ncbi:hypothetical protein WN55_04735 [Dufourea novaeangliae]|uniref:Uncharacterized protein n=1 Tax=Dufourea novaeangliae TaxID=178035 RepID=A0A154P1J0_DUFNO|nr:hypothetical protein WN55_04735 [Dufourea novaeangliae]